MPSKPSVLPPPARSTGPLGTLPPKTLHERSRAATTGSASFAIAASSNTHALALEHTCAIVKLGVQDCPKTKTDQARTAQAVHNSMLSHDRGDESQIIVEPDLRFSRVRTRPLSFPTPPHSLQGSTPPNPMPPCLSVPHRTLDPPHAPETSIATKRRQVKARSTLQPTTRPRGERASHMLPCIAAWIQEKEPHNPSSSLAKRPGLGGLDS